MTEIESKIENIIRGIESSGSKRGNEYKSLSKEIEKVLLEYAEFHTKRNKGKLSRQVVLFGRLRKVFSEEIKIKSIDNLTGEDLINWLDDLINNKKMKLTTIKLRKLDMNLFIKWYFKNYKKYKNYSEYYIPLKDTLDEVNLKEQTTKYHGNEDEIKRITWAQVNELTNYCDTRDKALLEFLLNTGYRVSECLSINVNDIKVIETGEGKFLYIKKEDSKLRSSIELFKCKNSLINWLSVHPCMAENDIIDLKQRKFPLKNKSPLWCTSTGVRIKPVTVWTQLRKLGDKAKYQDAIHPHVFRHGFGFWRKFLGIPIEQIKTEMGHRSIETTSNVYGKATVEDYILKGRGGEVLTDKENDKDLKTLQYCLNCGEESASYYKLCPSCGTALNEEGRKLEEERMKPLTDKIETFIAKASVCPVCESPNLENSDFCNKCGTALNSETKMFESYQKKTERQSIEIKQLTTKVEDLMNLIKEKELIK